MSLAITYLSRLGRSYFCGVSVVMLGEIVKVICEKASDKETRNDLLLALGDFIQKQNIRVLSIFEADFKLFFELRGIETRAHEPELLALVSAIRNKADVFMTFDKEVLQSAPVFKNKYGIDVRMPI